MPAPNRPLLSHMRHGPQHPNAKHRHQSRAHGSDHRITHAPSQRPRLMHLPCSVHHGSSLRPALTMDPSSQRRAYAAIDLTYAQLSFLKGWGWAARAQSAFRHMHRPVELQCASRYVPQPGCDRFSAPASKGPAMSAARKTLKILALIYFVLGIASLVIGIAGIAAGNLDSTNCPL